ncbi:MULTISPECIES: hypothetical protein [unclassified Leclercia]|uniref:hypothetical protein n=1 Tax=Leclercia TaxID=83654 RepID=UPI0020741C3B|nr:MULTISPECIES: hypothetical protein [unclassified Leclercia]MCM5695280.1 hypothetical protein [Leclercia sp. LTM01]
MPQITSRLWAVLTGLLVALVGIAYCVLGGWLAFVGGTFVFILLGVGFFISGILMFRQRLSGVWLYLLMFLACAGWALYEVGLDGWQLMPRLLVVAVLGVWISMPWVIRQLTLVPSARRKGMAAGGIYVVAMRQCLSLAGISPARGLSIISHSHLRRRRKYRKAMVTGNIMAVPPTGSVFRR